MLLALAVAAATGRLLGGRVGNLAGDPPRRNRLVLTASGLYLLAVLVGWANPTLFAIVSGLAWLTLAFYAWLNRERPGALLVSVGLVLNTAVLMLNGGMPVSADAAARAGDDAQVSTFGAEIVTADARLGWLGKAVPIAFPPRPEVVSPGDLAVAAGLGLVVVAGMRRRPAAGEATDAPALTDAHETIAVDEASDAPAPAGPPHHLSKEYPAHGQEGTQAPVAQAEVSQPRQASQRISM